MNVFTLKLIALVTMIIDHYGAIFHSNVAIYRIIGRLAFPIYCFLLVEGYLHTSNIKKYGQKLLIFALISEIPFDFAFYNGIHLSHQNIFFTLFIGLITMYLLDNKEKHKLKTGLILLISGVLSIILAVDYSIIGIIYILAFYYTMEYSNNIRLPRVGLILFITNILTIAFMQQYALLALPLLYFYNGNLGPKNKVLQMLFYIAYPLHLAIFYFLKI